MTFKSSPTSVKSFVQSPLYPGQSLGDFVKIKGINIDECSFSNGSFEVWNQKREWHSITFINAKWSKRSNKSRGLFVSKYCDYLSVYVCLYLCVDVCVCLCLCVHQIRKFDPSIIQLLLLLCILENKTSIGFHAK